LLFGVCAGVADYFDVDVLILRACAVASLIFFTMPTAAIYLVAAMLLKDKPLRYRRPADERDFWCRRHRNGGAR
jgi:phage shock protein C